MDTRELGNADADGNVTILVAGEEVRVAATASIKDTLKSILEERGIDSFTILVDGTEITNTNDLPDTFNGHGVQVNRYVKPGCNS